MVSDLLLYLQSNHVVGDKLLGIREDHFCSGPLGLGFLFYSILLLILNPARKSQVISRDNFRAAGIDLLIMYVRVPRTVFFLGGLGWDLPGLSEFPPEHFINSCR